MNACTRLTGNVIIKIIIMEFAGGQCGMHVFVEFMLILNEVFDGFPIEKVMCLHAFCAALPRKRHSAPSRPKYLPVLEKNT